VASEHGGSCGALDSLPTVEIDEGTFKYVLIRATDPSTGETAQLVRGVLGASYHKDAARPTLEALSSVGLLYDVLGGGRMNHNPSAAGGGTILIYGESFGFPWREEPMHDVTAALCEKRYPGYKVEWQAGGY